MTSQRERLAQRIERQVRIDVRRGRVDARVPRRAASGRRVVASIAALVLLGSLFVAGSQNARAVHDDNLFELGPAQAADILGDGNAANGPDWADVFDGSGNFVGSEGLGSFFADDLSQGGAVDDTTYSGAGGSNKNNDPITTWHWDAGNVPAKDDLSNVYAYGVLTSEEHLVVFVGFERIDSSGDSHIDLEFFQDAVGLSEAPPCNDPGSDPTPCDWVGTRTADDVIISMDFLNGGGFGTMTIREWNGVQYVVDETVSGEGCNSADTVCGFNNGGSINGGPWPNYDRHGDVITDLPKNAFTEIGVDVSAITGTTPCLSTMLGKTRSSQSFTAELKDFAGPIPFPLCDANIQISGDAVNEVGQEHTFTATVNKVIAGETSPADDGTIVTVDLTDANGAVSQVISDECGTSGTTAGTCTITFTSDTAGVVTGHASANVEVLSETLFVETDGLGDNSGDAVKRFVDAQIDLTPLAATNEVNDPHDITATVQQDDGLAADQGGDGVSGWASAPDGTVVSFSFALNTAGAFFVGPDFGPTSSGDNTVTINAPNAGQVVVHAETTFSVGGVSLTRATNTGGLNSDDAEKVYVDAEISITPTAVNEVGDPHTFTVTVLEDDGLGGGFVPAQGEDVDYVLTPANGAVVELDEVSSTCDDAGPNTDANGQCTIVFTSDIAGTVEGSASANVQVGGLSLFRSTDGSAGSSEPALKRFVAARLGLTPSEDANQVGTEHQITAHLEINYGDGAGFVDAPDGEVIDFAIDDGPGSLDASFCITSSSDGTCYVTLTSSTTGLTQVSASWTDIVTTAEGSTSVSADADPVVKRWVDARLSLEPSEDANLVGTEHVITAFVEFDYGDGAGFVAAPDGETIDLTIDSGPGSLSSPTCDTSGGAGTCTVILTSDETGLTTVSASWSGTITTSEGIADASADSNSIVKRWVDVLLTLTPPEAANQVDTDHEITAHLEFDTGTGFANAPDDELIEFAIDSGPGSLSPTSCSTTGGSGACSVTLTSSLTGLTVVSASWEGVVVTSEGSAEASADASPVLKRWVDARISVNPDGDNPIYTTHTFTVTLEFDYGSGFVAAPDGTAITDLVLTGVGSIDSETCSSPGTVGGSCEVTISSTVPGSSTLTAAWVGDVDTAQGTASSVDAGSDAAVKTWWDGSISVTKVVEFGPFTTSATVCFELARTDGTLYTTSENPQCFDFSPNAASHTFTWDGLTAGTYSLTETVTDPYAPMDPNPITDIVVDSDHRDVDLGTVENPLPPGELKITKLDETGALWTLFEVTFDVYWCGDDLDCSSLEGLVASISIPGDGNPVTIVVDEGRYLVRENVPTGWTALPDDEQVVDVFAGETSSVSFQNIPPSEGCTPGFWKTHPELWDGTGGDDVTTIYQTYDLFNSEFGVTSAYSGLDDGVTLLDALSVSGSELMALNRHAAAALPNADSGIHYPYDAAQVITMYQDAVGWIAGPETIATAHAKLSNANQLGCPLGDDPGSGGGGPAGWGPGLLVTGTRFDE